MGTSNGRARQCCGLGSEAPDVPGEANNGPVRVLITGASGLLGRQLMLELTDRDKYEVRGLCHSRVGPNLIKCDLMQAEEVDAQFSGFMPHAVIHLAAERRPDVVFKQPGSAQKLNCTVTQSIAEACQRVGSWLVFISTDYVFDGASPPYAVDAKPHPLSTYGDQKVEGETICQQIVPSSAVLRVPLLYGPMQYPKESGVTAMYEELERPALGKTADHVQKRYPTYTKDVARVLKRMVDVNAEDHNLRGIFHWQADECLTKYDMVQAIAELLGKDGSEVEASTAPPKFPTPPDNRLDCSRLIDECSIGEDLAYYRSDFKESLRYCLEDYFTNNNFEVPETLVSPQARRRQPRTISKMEAEQVLESSRASAELKKGVLQKFGSNEEMPMEDFQKVLAIS